MNGPVEPTREREGLDPGAPGRRSLIVGCGYVGEAVARRLGWTITKYNRKLDYLCRRLAESGVEGAAGEHGLLATSRRQVLVEHAVNRRLVVAADLDRLPPAD
jgi:hypothetical protein